jgi:hypothetical protein
MKPPLTPLAFSLTLALLTTSLIASPLSPTLPPPIAPPYIPTDKTKPIQPPFGLNWGENPENTKAWIAKNQHQHVEGTHSDNRRVLEVQGPFPDVSFDRIRFYFLDEQLTEVELQFNKILRGDNPEAEAATYTEALDLKTLIDSLYGKGHLIRHDQGDDPKNPWRYIHQVWTDEEHSIWLIVFQQKTLQPSQCLAITSIHYRWEKRLHTPQKPQPPEEKSKNKKN